MITGVENIQRDDRIITDTVGSIIREVENSVVDDVGPSYRHEKA